MEESFKLCRILNSTNYECSNLGTVRNIHTGKILSQKPCKKSGYIYYKLINDYGDILSIQAGRLVLMVWNPDADMFDKDCDHINGQKSDNRLENLRWLTHKENIQNIKYREKRFDMQHTRGIFVVKDDPEDEENKIVTYYRRLYDVDIPYETVRSLLRYKNYSIKHKCRIFYLEEFPEEYEKFIKVNSLF